MPRKIYEVELTDEERGELKSLTTKGRTAARKLTPARILLLSDENRERGAWVDATMRREIEAWQASRNQASVRVEWRFTTADARVKLKFLYPSIQM